MSPRLLMEYFENPSCAGSSGDTLEKFPKRIGGDIKLGDYGWGLHACEQLSFHRFNVLSLCILAGPAYFFVYWLVEHPGDLQNASVPLFLGFAFIGTFMILPRYVS